LLAIKKQPELIKILATGSLAFAVGLTSVAAYINGMPEHQNLTFSKEQSAASKDNSGQVAGASTSNEATNSKNDSEATSPQMTDTSLADAPALSSHVQGGTSSTASVPNVAGGNMPTVPVLPSPLPPVGSEPTQTTPPSGDGGGVLDPVINIVDGLTDGLGL